MKKIATICLTLCIACLSYAQNDWKAISDSLALESRAKADIVLSKFDTISGEKILYSLQDRDYLLIFKQDSCFKEYVVKVDGVCNILSIKEVEKDKEIEELKAKRFLSRGSRKHLKRLLEERQMVKDAFDTSQYSPEFKTSMPNATYVAGVPSYFVMKDENDKRYGEYSLSSITTPCPINPDLWAYLIRTLSEKTTLSPFVSVYKSDRVGNILPSYIFLRTQPQTFEIYSPAIYGSLFGQWDISNDTLFLFPEYEYFYRDSESRISKITPQDTSMPTIPQRYLIKDDSLIDITDYSAILPEPFNNQSHQMVYKRVIK